MKFFKNFILTWNHSLMQVQTVDRVSLAALLMRYLRGYFAAVTPIFAYRRINDPSRYQVLHFPVSRLPVLCFSALSFLLSSRQSSLLSAHVLPVSCRVCVDVSSGRYLRRTGRRRGLVGTQSYQRHRRRR